MMLQDLLSAASGSLVGFVLGLVGSGGSIIALPMLLYVVGVSSPHMAIGTSAIAVSIGALFNLVAQARRGFVKWPCAVTFSIAGMMGAVAGSSVALRMPGGKLLAAFGVLMVIVGAVMFLRRDAGGNPSVQLNRATAHQLLPLLLLIGFLVGSLAGFFGIGGGFLIVPGLMLATGMPISYAIGTSLVAVTAFGATTAANYALAGQVDWRIVALFIVGGIFGGLAGNRAGQHLAGSRGTLSMIFAAFVMLVGLYVSLKGFASLMAS